MPPPRLRRFLNLFFRLLYNELAFTYDLVSFTVSMGQWRAWQRTALPYLRGGRVLEIAHGPGHMQLDLTALGLNPFGVDLSAQMGRQARARLRRRGLPVRLARASVFALPFPAGAFTSLLSTFPTEFIGQPGAVAEFHRVLAPGGVLVCVPAAQITGGSLGDRFAEWLFRVTGQTALDWFQPLVAGYSAAGFRARVEQVRLPRSVVTVLIAEKPQ